MADAKPRGRDRTSGFILGLNDIDFPPVVLSAEDTKKSFNHIYILKTVAYVSEIHVYCV